MTDTRSALDQPPPETTQPPYRILQLSDIHLLSVPGQRMLGVDTEASFQAVLTAALAEVPAPDLVLLTGDLVQDPEPATYRRLKACLDTLGAPALCLPGNHDDPDLLKHELRGGWVRSESEILAGNWQLICLDSTVRGRPHGRLAGCELDRLAAALDRYPAHPALIALHHHPRPCGSRWTDTMVLENGEALFALLAERPWARGLVFGHIHQAMDADYQGLRLLSAPSTCFQFKPNQSEFALDAVPAGWRRMDLYPDGRIETRVCRLETVPDGLDVQSDGY